VAAAAILAFALAHTPSRFDAQLQLQLDEVVQEDAVQEDSLIELDDDVKGEEDTTVFAQDPDGGRESTVLNSNLTRTIHQQTVVELPSKQGTLNGTCYEFRGLDSNKWLPSCQWLGIPYAAPPVGKLRWKPTQPPAAWKGLRDANRWGSKCAQIGYAGNVGGSEDCLTLDIFAPPIQHYKGFQPYPVMIYIHGGGFEGGSAQDGEINPRGLVELTRDIIVVSVQYRLSIFGFLGGKELRSRDPKGSMGTYGLQDQYYAMKWVKDNIAAFGGNPHKITIFGESAGAASVALHLSSPVWEQKSPNLFQAAIMQSGGFARWNARTAETCQKTFDTFARYVGCGDAVGDERIQECLLALPKEELLMGTHQTMPDAFGLTYTTWAPCVDGVYLPLHPREALLKGSLPKDVHIIMGSNRDEGTMFVSSLDHAGPLPLDIRKQLYNKTTVTEKGFLEWASHLFGEKNAPKLAKMYHPSAKSMARTDPIHYIPSWWWAAARAAGDYMMVCPAQQAARLLSYWGNPTYLYEFDCVAETNGAAHGGVNAWQQHQWVQTGNGANHASELPFVFHVVDKLKRYAGRKLSRKMARYWSNLAYTGDPNKGPLKELVGLPLTPKPWPKMGTNYKHLGQDHAVAFRCPDSMSIENIAGHCKWWGQYAPDDVALSNIGNDVKTYSAHVPVGNDVGDVGRNVASDVRVDEDRQARIMNQ